MNDAAPTVTIRDAQPGDAETIAEFNSRLAIESEDKELDAETLLKGVGIALAQPEQCRYFIAEADGEPIGQTMITYELSDWRCGVLWWIQSVYVRPEFRRRGVLRTLFQHVENTARQLPNVRGLRLYVDGTNAGAIKAYESLGMREAGYVVYERDWSGAVRRRG